MMHTAAANSMRMQSLCKTARSFRLNYAERVAAGCINAIHLHSTENVGKGDGVLFYNSVCLAVELVAINFETKFSRQTLFLSKTHHF